MSFNLCVFKNRAANKDELQGPMELATLIKYLAAADMNLREATLDRSFRGHCTPKYYLAWEWCQRLANGKTKAQDVCLAKLTIAEINNACPLEFDKSRALSALEK